MKAPMPFQLTLALLCSTLINPIALARETGPGDEAAQERFKTWLASPPVIERLVYARTLPLIGQSTPFIERGLAGSTNQELFEVRWQTNALLHRQLDSLEAVKNNAITGRCFSLWDDHFYFLDAKTTPSLYVLEREKAARGIYPDPYHGAHIRMIEAVEPLNLGISHIYPGTVRWQGDGFTVVSMADKKPIWVRGQITDYSNGVPRELQVQYSNDSGLARYRITYDYSPDRASWFPSRIAAHLVRGEKEILYAEYHILSVKTAPAALPQSHFNFAPAVLAQGKVLLFLTNNSVYARLPSGRFIETPHGIPAFRLSSRDYLRNRHYYLVAGVWTAIFLVLGLRTWQTKTSTSS